MNPYQPPVPGGAFPPPQSQVAGPSQARCIIWLVLSCMSLFCGCSLLAAIPITCSIIALVKREQDPKLALTLNRVAIGCVSLGFAFLAVAIILNVVTAVMAN